MVIDGSYISLHLGKYHRITISLQYFTNHVLFYILATAISNWKNMKNYTNRFSLVNLFIAVNLLIITSCAPVNKLKFVSDAGPAQYKNDYFNDRSEKTIQPYDYLYIKIFSLDEKTNNIFNEKGYNV